MAAAERTFFFFLLALLLLVLPGARSAAAAGQQRKTYSVMDFHAAGEGNTDDTMAFAATWNATCRDSSRPTMVIPGGKTFLLSKIRFNGPCKSPITVQLDGIIVAPNATWTTTPANLLTFYRVDNLTVQGSGQIDGRGPIWWTCFNQKKCKVRPILLAFVICNNLSVRNIHLKDSPDKHMTLLGCSQVRVNNVSVTAPGNSPNTDGINMARSDHVHISSCTIRTGDDCISILSNTTDVNITDIKCGPGHGISLGSLGGDSSPALVERITVSNCSFFRTLTGVRIKSWQDGAVAISDARFVNIQGTSSNPEAIKIMCSKSVQCRGIYLDNVNLSCSRHHDLTRATISNAYGTIAGKVNPQVRFLGT